MKTLSTLVLALVSTACAVGCGTVSVPEPFGPVPTADQVAWQQMEYYMFVHFGPNTFTDVEWGDGREDPRVFNPTALDCRQWAATARAAGMKGIIITAKHHDGFCLWPSAHSTHTVRESGWRDGKGDVLRELSEACRQEGIGFGVYLSPWDQNHPTYGAAEYNGVFAATLEEVLSGYGPVFEQWFDGANGLARDGGTVPPYDWAMFHEVVYRNQPQAIIFSDVGPGTRWVGNERGVAGETNWSTINAEGFTPGLGAPPTAVLNGGEQGGAEWIPAEVDVSIRPGWFYSPSTDSLVKSTEKLMDIWYTSVGRNANLLLNVPPDRRGRIAAVDSVRLMEFRAAREAAFGVDLAAGAGVRAKSSSGRTAGQGGAGAVLDDDFESWWSPSDGAAEGAWLEIDFGSAATFNRLELQEYIPLGQRVASFRVESWDEAATGWSPLAEATTIGYKRILRLPETTASKIRIGFTALAPPVISGVGVYRSTSF